MSVLEATGSVRRALISAGEANNTLVAAVEGYRIRVLSYFVTTDGAVNIRFESESGGTALTGVMPLAAAGSQQQVTFSPCGHFETAVGELLNLELSDDTKNVTGHLVYQLVK
jgi:hypothetical protein